MILAAYLLAQVMSPIDAERAFASLAREKGQWTAFRAFATGDAVMFVPNIELARQWLARYDPPQATEWSPAASFISCDGKLAANTGPSKNPDGTFGYFSTIWVRQQNGGWKWSVNHLDTLATPRLAVADPRLRRAACQGRPGPLPPLMTTRWPGYAREGVSPDGTLAYQWQARPESLFAGFLKVFLWNGQKWDEVISDKIPPLPE